jgi:uncharacterized protein (TIGR03084 family)
MADVTALVDDARLEHDALAVLLRDRAEADWDAPTPAARWTVRDQAAHLAFFDRVTRLAISDQGAFERLRLEAMQDLPRYVEDVLASGAGKSGQQMLAWWAEERAALADAAVHADPARRIPWFGPSMSLASKITARIMETWAHGQDIVDALSLVRPPSARLAHVARIGVLAFANSYHAHGRDVPAAPVRVVLAAPDGSTWAWGPEAVTDQVTGPAEDFCLVVTQRRHVQDTDLVVTGPVATEWMSIAQAFAGPPGEGRPPGQFRPQPSAAGAVDSEAPGSG